MSDLPKKLPRHVAIVMDGNGRWAKQRGLHRNDGHRAGAETAATIGRCCVEWGIPVLTLYAFSTENWSRPRTEVRFLMTSLRNFLKQRRDEFVENDIRIRTIGATDELPPSVRKEVRLTEEATRDCTALTLVVALNYGAHREIADAARAIALEVQRGELEPDAVDETTVEEHLYTAGLPPLDLLIRTGAEMRLSNFLLWQASYAELYMTETLWPDFGREEFLEALEEFARRERRFGTRSETGGRSRPRRTKRTEAKSKR
ncbi:MAG: polyprenyl diphosphate synthase [Planctomycetota bacterium]|jgi:undecaprenyl diphosphate synthase